MELTASTALQLWYGKMQSAIMDGHPLNEVDNLGYNFMHYACLEGNMEVNVTLLYCTCDAVTHGYTQAVCPLYVTWSSHRRCD